jgi:DNA-binding transcriptional ArsR family regulator
MALADPTRVAIVARLAGGDATVKELTEPFALTQQAISRHLKVLEEAGLVSRRKAAQARPASLEVDRLVEVLAWVDARRREWVDRHNRLERHLRRLAGGAQAEPGFGGHQHSRRRPGAEHPQRRPRERR